MTAHKLPLPEFRHDDVLILHQAAEGQIRRMQKIMQLLCGLFVLYVAIGCLIGFALPPADPHAQGCLPYESGFVLLSRCTSAVADLFWSVVVSWPRSVIIDPASIVVSVKSTVKNLHHVFLPNAELFVPGSFLFALVLCVSFVYWEARSRPFAIGLTVTLLGEILYLGWLA